MFGFGKDNNSSKKSNRISDEKFKEALQNEIALMHIMKDPNKMKGQFPDVDKFSMNPNRQSLRTVTAYFIQNPKAAANLLKKNNLNDLRAHLYPEEEANRWGMSEEDWSDARRPKLRERISRFIGMQEGGQVKDKFGYGTYQKGGEVSKDKVQMLMEIAKQHIAAGKEMPDQLKEMIYQIPMKSKELYGGFFSRDEDFAEEVDTIKSYIAGDFKRRKDNRYVWGSLKLGKGETPESFILKNYPLRERGS